MKFSELVKKQQDAPAPTPAVVTQPAPAPTNANPFKALRQTMKEPPPPAMQSTPVTPAPNTVDALGDMEVGGDTLQMGEFPGQMPSADAPLTDQLQQRLQMLQAHMNTDKLDGQLTDTLIFLDKNPALHEVLRPEDIMTFVRALRSVYGTVIAKKEARKGRSKVTSEKVEEAMADLDDLGI